MFHNELLEDLIFLCGPLGLVASQFLDEEPSLVAFLGVLCRDNLCDLLPIIIIKVFDELGVLDHESEEAILEQMRLIILPLS